MSQCRTKTARKDLAIEYCTVVLRGNLRSSQVLSGKRLDGRTVPRAVPKANDALQCSVGTAQRPEALDDDLRQSHPAHTLLSDRGD
jgi:hypothetical protein